ncbi:sensor histidine kinase [Muricoccus radiodurans]|uniref:sensor histidine kinase n=1 Tax=Muricoccus radiodurans TaxID=2231721 RepID=UPI003CF46021
MPAFDPPAPPWNPADRLAALHRYRVLDTPRESDVDDMAAMAAEICGTPVALVSLVETDRQWFKAEIGLGQDSTPIDLSVCAHAIQGTGLFLVPDLSADPRFATNPVVTEMGMRFYAGAPLVTKEGLPLGTLCVLDRWPRTLSEFQRRSLERLARQVMVQLELRLALRRQGEEAEALAEAKERQDMLVLEMSHRVRNMLAVVQAIAMQTLRTAGSLEEARRGIVARLRAVARANDVLLDRPGGPARAGMATLARAMAELHAAADSGRFALTGPDLPLQPSAALAMGLALHELATNAAKYGALSVPGGRVMLDWDIVEEGRTLRLEWREEGGPPVRPPTRRGFGTRLIEDNLARTLGARTATEYGRDGLIFRAEAPMARVQETPDG